MVATEASVVSQESGYAALLALLAPLSLPPPAVTRSVKRLGFPGPFPPAFGLRATLAACVRVAHRALAVARFARPWTSLRERWITRPAACPAGRWTNGMDKRLRRPADRYAT